MKLNISLKICLTEAILFLFLQGCGGGGNSSESAPPNAGGDPAINTTSSNKLYATVVLSDLVENIEVTLKDSSGTTVRAMTDSGGVAVFDTATLKLPFLLRSAAIPYVNSDVTSTSGSTPAQSQLGSVKTYALYSYVVGGSMENINLTPISTAVVANITGNRNSAAFDLFGNPSIAISIINIAAVQSAEQIVLAAGQKLGIPEVLLVPPMSSAALIPVSYPKPGPYEQILSGDLIGALVASVSAVLSNAIQFACTGTAYGLMSDGNRRPSCLNGPNQAILSGGRITPVNMPRSSDPTTRADELVGLNAPGGGWKFRAEKIDFQQRRNLLAARLTSIIKSQDSQGLLNVIEPDSRSAIGFLKSLDWAFTCSKFTETTSVSEMSDISFGYKLLTLNLQGNGSSILPLRSLPFPYPPDSVDRLYPTSGPDNGNPDITKLRSYCALQGAAFSNQLTTLTPISTLSPPPPEKVATYAQIALDALDKLFVAPTDIPLMGAAFVNVAALSACLNPNETFPFVMDSVGYGQCTTSIDPLFQRIYETCRLNHSNVRFAIAQLTSSPWGCVPVIPSGPTGNALDIVTMKLSDNLVGAYENNFAVFWAGEPLPKVSVYAMKARVDGGRFSTAQLAAAIVFDTVYPDMDGTGLQAVGGLSSKVTQLPAKWKYHKFGDPIDDVSTINPAISAGILMCNKIDLACVGRLERTRKYKTFLPLVGPLGRDRQFNGTDTLVMNRNLVFDVEEALFEIQIPNISLIPESVLP